MAEIEINIKKQIQQTNENISQTKKGIEDLQADETNLKSKIERKQQELERREKRLRSLQGVRYILLVIYWESFYTTVYRPAFMDEYERLEADLQRLYSVYVEKFRNQTFLDHQVQELERKESERMAVMV